VGPLQFEVLAFRMQSEYNVDLPMRPLDYKIARWPKGEWDPEPLRRTSGVKLLSDREGRPVLLFDNQHTMRWIQREQPGMELAETGD
jgi:peptide chain release factor 3